MSSDRERRQSSLTPTQKAGARASDRWWPMREMQGKDRHGNPVTKEVYVDIHSGAGGEEKTTYEPPDGLGWNGVPPNLPSGDAGREGSHRRSERYRQNYDLIQWDK
jgi:hypothetical protein